MAERTARDVYKHSKSLSPSPHINSVADLQTTPIRRATQNFRLIWLDSSVNESDADFRDPITQLRRIVNTIDTYNDAFRCIDFLKKIKDEKVFMIVSGGIGQRTVPIIHGMFQLNSVYVYCENKSRHEKWAKEWAKVRGVFTEIGPICEALKQAAQQCEQDAIPISFISIDEASSPNSDQLDHSFIYTHTLKDILFGIDYDQRSIRDLAAYCRLQYANNELELNNISQFERGYHNESPIWWYTYGCFLYSMLNRALTTLQMDTIMKMGFFIRDLNRHIEELYSKQFGSQQVPSTVYRGQGLSKEGFEKLRKTKGGLISFNNVVSASKDQEASLNFATRALTNPDSMGILFKMTIDPSISKAPFALLDGVSYNEAKQEILFPMRTILRIGDMRNLDESNRLWLVELELSSDKDPLLSTLNAQMQKENQKESRRWPQLGDLLIKHGEFEKAEQLYRGLLDQASDDNNKAINYDMLGYIKINQGDYPAAIRFYKKALEIRQKPIPPNQSELAKSYSNIGLAHKKMGEYSKSILYYEKALQIYEKVLSRDNPELATFYDNVGSVYKDMGEHSKALASYEKGLEVRQKTLSLDHPDMATSYNNIGTAYYDVKQYSKALPLYEKAISIREKTLASDDPDLIQSYNNIGSAYYHTGQHSKALSFFEHALMLGQRSLSENHSLIRVSKQWLGMVKKAAANK